MATKSIYSIYRANGSTTLNEIYPSQSFHLDETMTIGKVVSSSLISGGPYRKRAIINFPFQEQTNYDRGYLQVFQASAQDLRVKGTIAIGFHTGSADAFQSGRGRRDSRVPVKEGSTWMFQNVANNVRWTEQTSSQILSFTFTSSADIDRDVSTLVGYANVQNKLNFVHIAYKATEEDDSLRRGEIEYYSAETHTIYQPVLFTASESVAKCKTGKEDGDFSLEDDYVIYHRNLKPSYQPNTDITFKFAARELYPTASYGTTSTKSNVNYLPSSSTYNFKDVSSNELVLPNSMQSRLAIESDDNGHYIEQVPSNLFHPYRKYKLVINVTSGSFTDTVVLPETFIVEA